MSNSYVQNVRNTLFQMLDLKYRDFQSSLMPTVDKNKIIGVRTPYLRKYAKKLAKSENVSEFLNDIPHLYYEEDNLHGFIIELYNDEYECAKALDEFLPYIDNWATCDSIKPKCFKRNPEFVKNKALEWIKCSNTYVKRYGIGVLMSYFLDDNFDSRFLDTVADIRSEEYYINMMKAWYFATALSKQYEQAVTYLINNRLDTWTHNKTIQKAVESYRISNDQKAYLKTLKKRKISYG